MPREAGEKHACPACGTVGTFRPDEPKVCKVCGTMMDAPPRASRAPVAAAVVVPGSDGPSGLAIAALVCGVLALVTFWVLPLSLLIAIAAIVLGAVSLSGDRGDSGAQAMGGIAIGLGLLALLLTWWVWAMWSADGGSSYTYEDGGSSAEVEDDGGSGSGGGGGGGGSGGDGGGSGGGGEVGGGGGSGGGGGGGVDAGGQGAPAPAALLVGLGLLGLAAWRRRA